MESEPLSRASTVGHLARSPESIMGMMLRTPGATMASIITGVSHEAERHVNLPSSCGAGKLVVHRKLKKNKKKAGADPVWHHPRLKKQTNMTFLVN